MLNRTLLQAHNGSLRHTYEYALNGFSASLPPEAVEAIRRNPRVALIAPVQRGTIAEVQHNAPWGLDRIDQRYLPLSATYEWQDNGAGVEVHIIDTGIKTDHAEFAAAAGRIHDSRPEDGLNGYDCNGHGTHVAGIAGGRTRGVARGVVLWAVKVNIGCTASVDDDDVIEGVDFVMRAKAANPSIPMVANMSLRFAANSRVDRAVQNLFNQGVAVIVAAGNDYGSNACNYSPARVPEAVTVAATDQNDYRASFSNIGSCLDVFAPGVSIPSAGISSTTEYVLKSGTSMASPHVAGAAALYFGRNPSAEPVTFTWLLNDRGTKNVVQNAGSGSPNLLLWAPLWHF